MVQGLKGRFPKGYIFDDFPPFPVFQLDFMIFLLSIKVFLVGYLFVFNMIADLWFSAQVLLVRVAKHCGGVPPLSRHQCFQKYNPRQIYFRNFENFKIFKISKFQIPSSE